MTLMIDDSRFYDKYINKYLYIFAQL